MIGESVQKLGDWKKVEEALADIRACRADSLRFFTETLDEFDAIFNCVEAQAEHLAERDALLKSQSVAAAPGAPAAVDESLLKTLTERSETDRQEMRKMQEGVQGQLARLAAIASELATTKTEFQSMRDDVERCNQEVAAIKTAAPAGEQNTHFAEMERNYSALQQERAMLEKELDDLRNRAADLTHSLSDQKRQSAMQQTQWNEELKKMRGLMETVTRHITADEPRESARDSTPMPKPNPDAVDPALSSVLAQFEMLQQDRAKRTG